LIEWQSESSLFTLRVRAKQWYWVYKLDLRNEFRIFIVNSEIKGICQKHLNYYFNYSEDELEEIKEAISNFYEENRNNLKDKTFVIDILYMKKLKKIKIFDVLSEGNINLLIKSRTECLDDEMEIKSYYKNIYLLYDNSDILRNLDSSFNIKVIKSEAEIFDTEENLNRFPIEIIGEDRNFGSNNLYIDMIPKTSYFKNVRLLFNECDWNLIRHHIYERAGHKCECCGIKRFKYLEAHERWIYDYETNTQKLIRIIALCRMCHNSTHYGHSKQTKEMVKIHEHLKKVKKINDEELKNHINDAYKTWDERNKIKWNIDTSIITNSGFVIKI